MSGNTRLLTDSSGAVSDTYLGTAFGEDVASTGSTPNAYRFGGSVGYYRDSSTRLHVMARNYNSSSGRWLSPDPIGLAGGDANMYRYVENSPLSFVDPLGLFSLSNQWNNLWNGDPDATPESTLSGLNAGGMFNLMLQLPFIMLGLCPDWQAVDKWNRWGVVAETVATLGEAFAARRLGMAARGALTGSRRAVNLTVGQPRFRGPIQRIVLRKAREALLRREPWIKFADIVDGGGTCDLMGNIELDNALKANVNELDDYILHEMGHRFLTRVGPAAQWRQSQAQKLYDTMPLAKYLEETLVEAFAKESLLAGHKHGIKQVEKEVLIRQAIIAGTGTAVTVVGGGVSAGIAWDRLR